MLFKGVTAENRSALSTAYIWTDTKQVDKLHALEEHFGQEFMFLLFCAYVSDLAKEFEEKAELPKRSGQPLLWMMASLLDQYMRKNNLI